MQVDDDGEPILCQGMQRTEPIGLELVTTPYSYEDMLPIARKFAWFLGTIPETPRTSIHVHVDVAGEPWTYVQRVLRWVYALEAPLFRMSCGGNVHRGARSYRGALNDHMYARPLSNSIGTLWGKKNDHVINLQDLLTASTASELAAAWGRLDLYWGRERQLTHYSPHRLHMVNLASVPRQGTFEWRIFDGMFTRSAEIVELVYAVHKLAERGDPDFAPMTLGMKPNIDAEWMSNLLGIDCSILWGENWQQPCQLTAKPHHYQNSDVPNLATVAQMAVNKIHNNVKYDDGSAEFSLYVR